MKWSTLTSLALVARANAFLRFSCSQLVTERLDPLVNPGVPQSPHLHQVHLHQNAFNTTMDPRNDLPTMASCTSCTFSEDFSNYWTAVLYFRARNGSYKRIPQMGNHYLEQANGGITVYYIPPYDGKTKVTAFKPGFRMLVGDVNTRTKKNTPEARQMSFRCYDKGWKGEKDSTPPGGGTDTRELPNKVCTGGIRAHNYFPTCWDGKSLDSPDHKSHVAFPSSGTFESGGPCPSTHPVKLPQILFEVMWNTTEFNDKNLWPEDGSQPFVYSYGDAVGYGHHADYVFGWKGDSLQKAMDANCGVSCPQLKTQATQNANRCVQQPKVKEQIDGWLDSLPGGVQVT
ncbi:hypothetical protein K469DRAFT_663271 [Zopfia rhizophila CBS 207.26]|uniref:DUF1996 domain-containing protein n=1 Tax=Zopfia rhizophila CBS 207.26 TaxID=1314779 RepID=A0A6A6EAP8_9PEZI|nr:hypothetical protein K469DRAFT_663271 [Zopfia rhizophila CBS 207.26]